MLLFPVFLSAQDIHFSQFYHSPLNLNPALAAVDTMDYRMTANYRGQWYTALVPYTTLSGAFEQRIRLDKSAKTDKDARHFLGLGLMFNYDAAGDAELSISHFSVAGSYTYALDRENFISGGLQIGLAQRSFKPENLTFDHQFNGDIFDPGRPINESFTNTNNFFADLGVGLNYHGQQSDKRTKLDVGVGLYHLNRPDQSFLPNDAAPLPMRWSLYIMPDIQLSKRFDLALAGSAQLQTTYFEALAMVGPRYHIVTDRAEELAILLGLGYRFNAIQDALIATMALYWKQWTIGFTYDFNISDFQAATDGFGGPEIGVRYVINRVDALPNRLCRLY